MLRSIGIRPVIIRSRDEVDVNKWTPISIARRHGEGVLKVGDAEPVNGKAVGPARTMYLKTHLYIGGYDRRVLLNKGVEVNRGFDGCISGVSCIQRFIYKNLFRNVSKTIRFWII